jgi:Co/Zn/Cd efflux system component
LVALIGLVVNVVSAFILHYDPEHSDHNIRAAYLYIVADALPSVSAILGLTAAMIWDITTLMPSLP